MSQINRNCAGIARRDFLQLGVGAVLGFSMVDLMRVRAEAARSSGKISPDQVNCILIWMDGGPSHYETFDPKPYAPKEIRGALNPIKTSVPGIHFCETAPKLAAIVGRSLPGGESE